MNPTKKITLALGLVVAGASFAQTASTTAPAIGVLGQSYSEFSYGVTDITRVSKDQQNLGVAANVPVTPHLDLGASYGYSWLRGIGHTNDVAAGATAYTAWNGVKPFVGAGLGYEWDRYGTSRDDSATWGLAAGVEIPVSVVSITPQVVYADDFHGRANSAQQWTYGVEGNYWITKTAAVFGDVGYVDVHGTSDHAWQYTVGARFRF